MWNELIFRPLYNGLIGIMDLLPWADVGVAVVIFTIVVKLILYPLSKSALLTQAKMKEVEPEATEIRKKYADDRQLQAQKIMELYKSKNIKPFAGILLLFIQLPILFALISVFYKIIPEIDASLLYGFVSIPELKTQFIGLVDLTTPSISLALITAVAQYLQIRYSLASSKPAQVDPNDKSSMPAIMNSMQSQMKYMIPVLAFVSLYWIIPTTYPMATSIIALYWATSSLMTLFQELHIRRQHLKK